MKKLFAVVCGPQFFSMALASPLTPSQVIGSNLPDLQAACDKGYEEGNNPKASGGFDNFVFGLKGNLLDGYVFQSSGGSTFSKCRADAKALKSKSTINTVTPALMFLAGTVSKLSEAKDWATVLSFRDNEGNETLRLSPTESDKGSSSGWDTKCSSSSCVWRGNNYYIFDFSKMTADEKASALKASTVTVLVNTGKGLESFVLDSDQAGKFR